MAEIPDGKISESTRAVRAGAKAKIQARTVNPPIQRGSTVLMPSGKSMYDSSLPSYGRSGLSPHGALTEALSEMEGGAGCTLYPNGLAAVTGVLLSLLSAGDEVLVVDSIYNPSRRFCDEVLARFGVTTRYVDPRGSVEAMMADATGKTRLFLLESPASLTLDILDVPELATAARARNIVTVIDNTWGAGLFFKPLDHGIDISVQALTKYVGGHSDVFMGAAVTRDPKLLRRLEEGVINLGWSASPDDAYLMLRGLRTLPTRLARHQQGALAVAAWLAGQPEVSEVICPGLPGSRGHDLWTRDFHGQNGLVTIVLQPKSDRAVHALLDAFELFGLGYSWGGFESLAIHCDPQLKRRTLDWRFAGPLVRLQVGLEDPDDLIADLRRGLDAYAAAR
jgi:cystathionine beta-lyase